MKKTFLLVLSLLLLGNVFAQKAATTKLLSSTEERIVVQVDLNGFSTDKVMTPQGVQYIVNAPRMASMLKAGAPDLPMFPIPAIIGDRAEMTVNVIDAQYTDYTNIDIAPSKGNFSRQINPDDVPYTYGEMYQQDAFWPATQAYLEAPYILRDFRGQNIMVRPFAYNPVTRTLRVYEHMTIEMTKVSDNGVNQKLNRRSNTVKADIEFLKAYEERFINFKETESRYTFVVDQGSMLIVCVDAYLNALQPLADWKNISGRPTTITGSSTTGTDTQLKSYIQNYYAEHPDLSYILLVGEHSNLPGHSMNGGRSDIFYGMLEGNDLYAEVLVGRFSPSNVEDAAQQAARTIYYERDVDATAAWCNHGMGIGHTDGPGHYGETDWQHIDKIRDTLMHYTYTQVTQRYVNYNTVTNAIISQDINDGISIANYCNHGSETTWAATGYSTTHVNALTNDYMLPYVISVACNNGQFDVGECFGESWMRSVNEATGAPCGAIGGMFSWISQPWQPPMYGQDEMNRILTEWVGDYKHTMGGASINGSMFVLDSSPEDNGNTYATWILFGDPSVMLRTDNPTVMNASVSPSVLMLGMNQLDITTDAGFGIATLSMNGQVLASSYLTNGQCSLTFEPLNNVGTAQLVIIGYNKVTCMAEIEVVPAEGAYIVVNSHAVDVNQVNNGDTVNMNIDLKNVGVEIASELTATLTTNCEYVEIISGENTVAAINPDEVITVEGYQFYVDEAVPDGTMAAFTVTITDGTNTWENAVNIPLHAPALDVESIAQYMEEDVYYVKFTFKNIGSAPFYGGTLNVYPSSSSIVFDSATLVFDDVIEGDGTIELITTYTVNPNVEPGSTFEIAYEMTTGLLSYEGSFTITYGTIMEDFESGQFGSNWTLSSVTPWTITEGGTKGNYCAMSTNHNNNSEGYMILTVDVLAPGDLTFWYKVSSENNYDKLHFYMDNQEKGVWSGTSNVEWAQFTQPVTTGTHSFKWSYTKDSSVSNGSDCAWIDDIVFPPTHVVTFIAPVMDLEANVDDRDVTLTWRGNEGASQYIITRDGEEIATVSDDTFTDVHVPYGEYEYSVTATNDDGAVSVPVSINVEVVDWESVEDNTAYFKVYPNPTNGILYINSPADFTYSLYNNMGQEMKKGYGQGMQQINASDLSKGVYFLQITTGNRTNIQKIVVK